ncbi:hypothetical protein GCM10011579_075170 [Streptomyces albiflavescens]|uniref:Uncharacterized protein n=1 Tax=Streptomyces albiflavescens TaxID=1623582 RepID=A0A917YD86_9ACTN|nr:hypothetical protein GCM10011579_075170 [Streptomyces albiflavescens]
MRGRRRSRRAMVGGGAGEGNCFSGRRGKGRRRLNELRNGLDAAAAGAGAWCRRGTGVVPTGYGGRGPSYHRAVGGAVN